MKDKRTREEITKDALKRWLNDEGWTVLGVSLKVSAIAKGEGQYGQTLTVTFDGVRE